MLISEVVISRKDFQNCDRVDRHTYRHKSTLSVARHVYGKQGN